jgi:hypothetical protein
MSVEHEAAKIRERIEELELMRHALQQAMQVLELFRKPQDYPIKRRTMQ